MTNFKEKYEELGKCREYSGKRKVNHYLNRLKHLQFKGWNNDNSNRLICLNGFDGDPFALDLAFEGTNSFREDSVYQKIESVTDKDIQNLLESREVKYSSGGKGLREKKQHKQRIETVLNSIVNRLRTRKLDEAVYRMINFCEDDSWLKEIYYETSTENLNK